MLGKCIGFRPISNELNGTSLCSRGNTVGARNAKQSKNGYISRKIAVFCAEDGESDNVVDRESFLRRPRQGEMQQEWKESIRETGAEAVPLHSRRAATALLSSFSAWHFGLQPGKLRSAEHPLGPGRAEALGLSLEERIKTRQLKNNVFNIPPKLMLYPQWLAGEWDMSVKFNGYDFPSRLSKDKVVRNASVPGFQKLSLIYLPDVGKSPVSYKFKFKADSQAGGVVEDREFNLQSVVAGYLGPDLVEDVAYSPKDPNRTTVTFRPNATRNAERIELFSNSRESQTRNLDGAFYTSECIRQVSLGYTQNFGVARMLVCDYQNAWTFIPVEGDPDTVVGELLTAGYLQSSEPDYFEVLTNPVVVFSHKFTMKRQSQVV